MITFGTIKPVLFLKALVLPVETTRLVLPAGERRLTLFYFGVVPTFFCDMLTTLCLDPSPGDGVNDSFRALGVVGFVIGSFFIVKMIRIVY